MARDAGTKSTGKITALLDVDEFNRFDTYCRAKAFKKSPLIVRLIREHLDAEGWKVPDEASTSSATAGGEE